METSEFATQDQHGPRLIDLLRSQGVLRIDAISQALGITRDHAAVICNRLTKQGKLTSCKVEVPGGRPQNEYRLAAGPPAPFVPLKAPAVRPPRRDDQEYTPARTATVFVLDEVEEIEAAPAPVGATGRSPVQTGRSPVPRNGSPVTGWSPVPRNGSPVAVGVDAGAFSCALWSDGKLTLRLPGGESVTLTPSQTRELCAYLERMTQPEPNPNQNRTQPEPRGIQ